MHLFAPSAFRLSSLCHIDYNTFFSIKTIGYHFDFIKFVKILFTQKNSFSTKEKIFSLHYAYS